MCARRNNRTDKQTSQALSCQFPARCHWKSFILHPCLLDGWQWVLGGGVGVPCTANPLYGGLTAEAEAQQAAKTLISETVTIRPLRLAVSERLP